jgi:hypothetical protein
MARGREHIERRHPAHRVHLYVHAAVHRPVHDHESRHDTRPDCHVDAVSTVTSSHPERNRGRFYSLAAYPARR